MRLSNVQKEFGDIILNAQEPGADFIAAFAGSHLPERLNIYRNNVMGNVGNALANNFPLLEKLVGRDFLMAMVRGYILKNPPKGGCLIFYGSDFDRFVAGFEAAKNLPYLADMARLEIAINESYHADDDEALKAEELIGKDLVNYNLKLRHSVKLVRSVYALDKIRDFCLEKTEAPDVKSETYLLIHRPHLDVAVTVIAKDEYRFLSQLQTRSFGLAVEDTLNKYPDFNLQSALQRFMTLELFGKE